MEKRDSATVLLPWALLVAGIKFKSVQAASLRSAIRQPTAAASSVEPLSTWREPKMRVIRRSGSKFSRWRCTEVKTNTVY